MDPTANYPFSKQFEDIWLPLFGSIPTNSRVSNILNDSKIVLCKRTTDLLGERGRVGAYIDVALCIGFVNVLQTFSISVHHQPGVVVKEHANTVVTQLVAWNTTKILNTQSIQLY